MPLALLCRLGFSDRGFVDQLVGSGSVGPEPWARYLGELLLLLEPDSEPEPGTVSRAELLLSLLGQVCRCSAHHLPYVRAVVSPAGDWGTLRLALCHPDPGLRRKACSLTAWLLSEQGAPPVPLLEAVLPLLGDPEPGVRESAGLAVGNAAFGGSCVTAGALPALLHLLSDPSPRTRRHACSALHNLGTSHCSSSSSGQALGQLLLSSAVPQRLLQLAAPQRPHSQPAPVREAALSALRALAQWPHIREVLISMNSCEKLSLIVQETEQCVLVSARNTDRSVLHHCHRLLETLSTSPSE
ncbi:serine/threonine-protein kinase 36-like [Chiloscyllium plagiosum]|uniref:serine/threonine-protein kinase 36-like n=1 Tax=Chiloscyllium plagiosum TaxID=36176 RepID=UPI001CB86130|nr:serine/threonine-protein kinase 36-like [Chiloscyllium plagiosum]